jgi:SAM-dependent methyltransferase/prolyl-tRNA editing enzyme YbaK/EbsC (Cys-tRNA(Pro) deacylase)
MTEFNNVLEQLKIKDVSFVLKKNFEAEKMDKFFTVDENFTFGGTDLMLDKSNSIKLNFKTAGGLGDYKLLLILALNQEENFSHRLITDFQKILDDDTDKIVLWSMKKLPVDTLQSLKTQLINVVYLEPKEIEDIKMISNFFPIYSQDYNYPVTLNKLCNQLVKRLKKLFHIVLSEIAAPIYDKEYGTDANLGTKAIMEFEEVILNSVVGKINYAKDGKGKKIAIDVGCGTGRHSFIIAENFDFDKIYGFDFSPKMIEQANKTKKKKKEEAKTEDIKKKFNNVIFSVADLEYEDIHYENDFKGKVDLVVASFGMGSFIEDTAKILRRYHQWLKPGGKIILSFYNKNSIILQITPNWRDTSLAAHIDMENSTLQVKLSEDILFQIFCKPFDKDIESIIRRVFDIEKVFSYPTTMALLPNSLLKNKKAFQIFSKIDLGISEDKNYGVGHYILVVGTKPEDEQLGNLRFDRILERLQKSSAKFEIIEHDLVLSVEDVKRVVGIKDEKMMLKTIVFRIKDTKNKPFKYIAVVLQADKKVLKDKILEYIKVKFPSLEISKDHSKIATEREIIQLGFSIGGISPLGFFDEDDFVKIIDEDLQNTELDYFFMGAGDNRKTLKLAKEDFENLTVDFEKMRM